MLFSIFSWLLYVSAPANNRVTMHTLTKIFEIDDHRCSFPKKFQFQVERYVFDHLKVLHWQFRWFLKQLVQLISWFANQVQIGFHT